MILTLLSIIIGLPSMLLALIEIYKARKPKSLAEKTLYQDTFNNYYSPMFMLMYSNKKSGEINLVTTIDDINKIISKNESKNCITTISSFVPISHLKKIIKLDKFIKKKDYDNASKIYNNLFKLIYVNYCIYKTILYKEPNHVSKAKTSHVQLLQYVSLNFLSVVVVCFSLILIVVEFFMFFDQEAFESFIIPFWVLWLITLGFLVIAHFLETYIKDCEKNKYKAQYDKTYRISADDIKHIDESTIN